MPKKYKPVYVGISLLIGLGLLFTVDYCRHLSNRSPIFAIPIFTSTEATTYVGLGYKVVVKNRNITELITLFGKHRNFTFQEEDIEAIEEFVMEGYTQFDNAKSFIAIRIYSYSFLPEDRLEVYIWALEETFYPHKGKIVPESGYSMPFQVIVDISNGGFQVIGKQFPRGEGSYSQDMKELFPPWVRFKLNNIHRTSVISELSQETRSKARQHFYPLEFDE